MSKKKLLEFDSVDLRFDNNEILSGAYLIINENSVASIIGRNGTGKSCMMKIIFGEMKAQNYFLRIDGKIITGVQRNPEDVMYLSQSSSIPKYLTVKKVFQLFKSSFDDFVSFFPDLEKIYNSKINSLSGGENRIIMTYLILTAKTKLALLDEPFSQIMPKYISIIVNLIKREKNNKSILITDHFYKSVFEISDDIYVVYQKRINKIKELSELTRLGYIK
jgi:ABC-type branched-subunit amino acid transport system ATPase component